MSQLTKLNGLSEEIPIGIKHAGLTAEDPLFPSWVRKSADLSTRQYARIVDSWVEQLGRDRAYYGTHTLRRTKATLIYPRTKNLRAVQLLLGHTKLESTVRYLGMEVTTLSKCRADGGVAPLAGQRVGR